MARSLEEIAALNKKLGLPANAHMGSRIAERLNRGVAFLPAQIAALPARGARNVIGSTLFGPKNMNPLSPAFGKRLNAVGGDSAYKQISKAEFDAIRAGEKPGKAIMAKTGPVGNAYFKQRFRPGGLVGMAQKHPLLAGGAGLLAYYLATNRGARQAAGGMASGMAPTMTTQPTAAVQKEWGSNPSFENPLASQVWGK